jgi:myosin-crossreactive antigen
LPFLKIAAFNDIITDVITKVVKVTKALIVVKNVLTIDDPVVEVIANKIGRHTLAEAALKLDKLQQTQKTLPITLPIIDKRSSTRNKKTT